MTSKKEIKVIGSNHRENTALFQEIREIKNDIKELKKFFIAESNNKQEKEQKEQLKKRLITAYQKQAKNKNFQAEMSLWDSISGDGLNDK